jgi:hypothetical protein
LFVEVLPGLEAVVELSEEAVEQVALGGVVPVAVLASSPVVGVRPRGRVIVKSCGSGDA